MYTKAISKEIWRINNKDINSKTHWFVILSPNRNPVGFEVTDVTTHRQVRFNFSNNSTSHRATNSVTQNARKCHVNFGEVTKSAQKVAQNDGKVASHKLVLAIVCDEK